MLIAKLWQRQNTQMLLKKEGNFSWSPVWGQTQVHHSLFHTSQCSFQNTDTTVFLENIKRSTQRCCNKQYFLFPHSSSPQGYRSFNGRIGYFKMNCSLRYFHWQFNETVSSSLSNCFWSTKEEHAPLKENYFDTAGMAPSLKRLTCKRASNRQ